MALDFKVKDVVHRIAVKFTQAFLPNAHKPYNLRAVFQPELDIHGIASKADVYNITVPPKVIEEGLTAGMELIYYLAADGYKVRTPVFSLRIRVPGEYSGDETHLPEGVYPEGRLTINAELQRYLKETVKVDFAGIDADEGFIAEAFDEKTAVADQVCSMDELLDIRGSGLKVDADAAHAQEAGVFFELVTGDGSPGPRVKAKALALNEPRFLKVIVPMTLTAGSAYKIVIVTQTSPKSAGTKVKNIREVKSEFVLTAQA